MASHPDTHATPGNTNRFSNASLWSLSSVATLIPEYNAVVDTTTSTATNPGPPPSSVFPNRFSNASLSSVATLVPSQHTADRFQVGGIHVQEFRYSYPIRPKNPWATLHLHTRDTVPGDSRPLPRERRPKMPRFWSCDPIRGTVELNLDSPQSIQRISITLKGSVIMSSHSEGSSPFLNREFTVWDKLIGDPLQSNNTASNGTPKKNTDTRLASGQYTFPFSFPFPTHTDPTSNNGPKNTGQPQMKWTRRFGSATDESPSSSERSDHPRTSGLGPQLVPQTFMENGIDPHVAYNISLRIVHGRFKANSKIKTNIAYFRASEPPPASQKRREAYEASALLPSPMNDPEGWFALPTVTIPGVVKTDDGNLLNTSVDCKLCIAQPLSYTRGSLIPCFITIHSDSVEVAHLLPGTARPTVRLLRRVWHPLTVLGNSKGSMGLPDSPGGSFVPTWSHILADPISDMKVVTHEVGHANWWIPSKDVIQDPNTRHFEGEIHLSPDLKPSCDFQLFRTEYAVELLSFRTANFTPEISPSSMPRERDGKVIASNPVEITTLYRQDEPVPTAYSEPPETYPDLRRISSEKAEGCRDVPSFSF